MDAQKGHIRNIFKNLLVSSLEKAAFTGFFLDILLINIHLHSNKNRKLLLGVLYMEVILRFDFFVTYLAASRFCPLSYKTCDFLQDKRQYVNPVYIKHLSI